MDVDCDASGEKMGDGAVIPKVLLAILVPLPLVLAKEAPPVMVMSTLSGVAAEEAFNAMELSSKLIAVLAS